MSNNLLDVERSLRYIAKRYKSVKFSVGLAIMFLMMGVGAFSADVSEIKAEATAQESLLTRPEIGGSVESIRDKSRQIRKENDKALSGARLDLVKLMEQGNQVVKSPWSSWQFGANYYYDHWGSTYKGKGDKAQKYPYEGIFERSTDPYERNISPDSSSYAKYTALKEKERAEKGIKVDPTRSATSSIRKAGGVSSDSYGIASNTRVQEPIASLNIDATVRPKEVGRKPVSVDEIKTKVPAEVNVLLNVPEVEEPKVIVPKEVKVTVKTPKVSTKPFMDFRFDRGLAYESYSQGVYDAFIAGGGEKSAQTDTDKKIYLLDEKENKSDKNRISKNNKENGLNEVLWSGHNGTNYTNTSGTINKVPETSWTTPVNGTIRTANLVYMKFPNLLGNRKPGTNDKVPDEEKIDEDKLRVGGFIYGTEDGYTGKKKTFHLAGDVDKDDKGDEIGPNNPNGNLVKPGLAYSGQNKKGVIGLHIVWNGTVQNLEGNLWGKSTMFSIETWHAPKVVFKNVDVNFRNDENTLFYISPARIDTALNNVGDRGNAVYQRGAFLSEEGKGVNANVYTNGNIIYSIVGVSGSFNMTNRGKINFEGANNIFYSGLGFSPNLQNLIGEKTFRHADRPPIQDYYQTGMTPVINMNEAINSYGDNNTILYFSDLVSDESIGIDVEGNKIDKDEFPKTTSDYNNMGDSREWKSTKIGIFQGEVKAAARIGEKLNIDGGDSQTKKGNIGNVSDSNKWVENNVVILAQSGQRSGITPSKDLGFSDKVYEAVDKDAIHPLYVNDIDATFGKYSKRNIMIDSERGTQIDVAITDNKNPHHTDKILDVSKQEVAGKKDGGTIPVRTEAIKDYNVKSTDFENGKLVSSTDDNANKAATGTILALAKGTWGDGEAKQRRLNTNNDYKHTNYGISVDTINALKDKPSEINFGVPVEMSAKMAKENGVELRPIAYMAEGGKITVSGESLSAGKENTTKAYGYGSLIAYANKYEHKYKSNPDLAEPDKSTVSYGDIHIDGNIEAVDEWAADDAATKLEKYNNVGAYASGKGGSGKDGADPEKNSKVVITGNAKINGTAAYASEGGVVEIQGKNSEIKAGEGSGLVATKGGTVRFGGGTIEVKNNFDNPTKYDNVAPVYADDKGSVIEITGNTDFNLYDGVIDLADVNDYKYDTATMKYTGKYKGFKDYVTLNIKKDGINLGQIDNTGSTMIWNGTDDYVKSLLANTANGGEKQLFKDVTAKKDGEEAYYWTKSYVKGGTLNVEPKAPATTLNISINDENDGYNHISLRKTLVNIKEGVTVTRDASNTTFEAQGLSIQSDKNANSNDETGFVNSGLVKVKNGILTPSSSTAAMSVNYGKIENKNKIEMTNAGVGIFGTNGSKLVNDTTGTITVAEKGIGIAANASSKVNSSDNVTFGTDKAGATGNVVDILNAGKIDIKGKDSIGISVKNNSDKDRSKVLVKNTGDIVLGDNGAGISVKSTNTSNNEGATIELAGNITVGAEGIGTYAQNSDVKLTDNLNVNVKDSGVGIYLKDNSKITAESGKKLILNYNGSNTGKATGVIFDGNNLTNNIDVEINNTTNTTAGLTNLLANGTGTFTNKGNIKTVGVKGYGIVANKDTLTSVVNEGDIDVSAADSEDNPNIGIYAKEAATAITNKKNIKVGKNSIGIYGHGVTLETDAKIETSDNAVGIYSNSKDVTLKAGSILNIGKDKAVGIYAAGSGQNIKLSGNISIGDGGYGLINNNEQANNTIVSKATLTKDLGSDTVFIYSKDKLGSVENHTNLKATGNENYGIYGAGKIDNYGNIDFKAGKGNVGIYSTSSDGTKVATNYATIEVGASVYDKMKPKDAKYAIGMAGGYTPARNDKNEDGSAKTPFTGHIVNKGTIKVTGEHSIGMFATEGNSTLENKGDIILSASNTTGIYLDNKAVGHNYGRILSEGEGLENLVGIVVKNGATIYNHPNSEIRLNAKNSKGIYVAGAGNKKGIIKNYGDFVISADKKEASLAGAKISVQGEGSSAFDENKSKLDKEVGGVKLDEKGIYDERLPQEKPIKKPNLVTVDPKTIEKLEKENVVNPSATAKTVSSFGMYIDTSNINFTKPIEGIENLEKLTEVDLIIGNEAAKYTNSKYIEVDPKIYEGKNGGSKSYNDLIIDNPQIAKWSIYSGSLTWMSTIKQDEDTGAIKHIYLAKIPYTEWAGNEDTPVDKKDTYNFLDGLEQRYGVESRYSRERRVFDKLNSIGNNEQILLYQATDEMMGHQYANIQQRVHSTGTILDKEFNYLRKEWQTFSKDSNKVKVFGMRGEYKTDTAGVIDYRNHAEGVAYVHEDEDVKLGRTLGWYTGLVHNEFKFRDIGNSRERMIQGKLGVFKSIPFDDNNSFNVTVSGEIFGGYNRMKRRYLVVDEVFGARGRYYDYGIAAKAEVGKEFRLSEDFKLRPYTSIKPEYGRITKVREKSGEIKLEVKSNDYISLKPEIGAELEFKHLLENRKTFTARLGVSYDNELGRVANGRNKARVAETTADWFNIRGEKEDRRGNVKTDLNLGLDNSRLGVTANIGYDTKGSNIRGGVGLRVIY